ncbi:unnamed protein product [Caenorhabditis auriculariae]|uniref:protein-tyrosine-phosphatase n=1 Tax=Caenorhabditis auriculariae TaxID=2777116 RepID=A0A8S1HX77_9PELO|nr:unnamed protein product [Caenorhabditis auriculariae]
MQNSPPSTSKMNESLTGEQLNRFLCKYSDDEICILDCRTNGATIKRAIRVQLPNVLLRRLLSESLQLTNVSPKLQDPAGVKVVVIPGENSTDASASSALINSLRREEFDFHVLAERMENVLAKFPQLRDSKGQENNASTSSDQKTSAKATSDRGGPPLGFLDLGNLRLQSDPRNADKPRAEFPVEILPYLYLGNAETACNRELLDKHSITFIINVTTNLPNEFEDDPRFHYLRIPVDDSSAHNLTKYFAEANAFIEAAKESEAACLVHCLAGISRSVTICLAYIMSTNSYTLEDAYDMVQHRNASIAPNFHFMGQLSDYERHLGLRSSGIGTYPSSAPRSPCAVEAAALLTPPPTSCSASSQGSAHSAKSFR